MTQDPIDLLSAIRPTTAIVDAEWSPAQRAQLQTTLLADRDPDPDPNRAPVSRVRFTARRHRRRWTVVAPVAAGIALVLLIAGVLVYASRSDDGGRSNGLTPAGPPFDAATVHQTPQIGAHQFSYRADSAYTVDAGGKRKLVQTNKYWSAPDGSLWSLSTSHGKTDCIRSPFAGSPTFDNPTKAFLDDLPTGVDALTAYLRGHVQGSSSTEEAVFVAVGDMLRMADGMASSQLRAGLVGVLSRTDGVTVHRNVHDVLGRPAVRADFVDQQKRPGAVASLYFDRATFQLLEERDGSNGEPSDPGGPSVAYTRPPIAGDTPAQLSGPANVDVMTSERVVDHLPDRLGTCH